MTILDALNDPQLRHAAVVHLPIALAVLATLPALVSAVLAGRNTTLRWTVAVAYALLLGACFVGTWSGEDAKGAAGQLADVAYAALQDHEEMAERAWMLTAAALVLSIVTLALRAGRPRLGAAWLTVAAGLVIAGWMGLTGHRGGVLVYQHGVLQTASSPGEATDDPRVEHFRAAVLPVLQDRCMGCHNPEDPPAGLDLTRISGLLRGGESGPALIPGDPDGSLLLRAVRHEVEDLEMPPKGGPLAEETIAALERWVRDGAVWTDGG